METLLGGSEEETERFLSRLRQRFDMVGLDIPKVEVRYKHLCIEGDAYLGTRALPTLPNSVFNEIEGLLEKVKLSPSTKKAVKILHDVRGIIRPSRMTLLIGPPGSGKTTLLKALSGMLDKELRVTGRVTYCGHEMSEFIPQKTCAYISQHDLHHGEMSVRETIDFARFCFGVGTRYELLEELTRREMAAGIKPDPDIHAIMKATAMAGQESSLVTDYVLKILDLDACANLLVGDEMRRGISGGEKKRLTIGEMLVSPAKAFFIDEASTGLDSATTYQIVNHMRKMVHVMDMTMTISLLQPAPETFELFDDIILVSEGRIVYQGPRENVVEFFESVGFRCPERKGVADFIQEIISMKDQEQYWNRKNEPYQYITAADFAELFSSFHVGEKLSDDLSIPFDKSTTHPDALATDKCGISNVDLFKACLSREWLLMKHSSILYIFKTTQIIIMAIITLTVFFRTEMKSGRLMDANKFYGALFFSLLSLMFNGLSEIALTVFRLPVFFKQRDSLFYPAWAFALPIWFLRIPLSLMESLIWILLTYYSIGFAPSASRFFCQLLAFFAIHQMSLSLFRLVAAIGRTQIVANTLGTLVLLMVFLYGGFIISKDDIAPWMRWGYYISPTMYGQNALAINEFLDHRWDIPNTDPRSPQPTVGKVFLASRGMFLDKHMYWICVAALFGFSFLFNICFVIALTYLDPYRDSKSVTAKKDDNTKIWKQALSDKEAFSQTSAFTVPIFEGIDMAVGRTSETCISIEVSETRKRGMMLPFQPLSLTFTHVNYYVDMPLEMKTQGIKEPRMQLLRDVSGAFRPGVLTALVGVSGAGKTTLMDVLAGRKTGGYIEGSINISGYPKNQLTFARISGYCEQNDIHSPHVTVYESLVYSAWLRLSPDIKKQKRKMFIDEVMELVELDPIKNVMVGLPGVDGLSTEQRKRLTIAVELVANPSIIFMDEPTTSLDARAAAIVMRTVRNTVNTGRTVVCTIHQPSIDIFEAFDELLLMKRGGEVIYGGPLGQQSCLLLDYFGSIPGVPKIKEGTNPATWVLEISTPAVEAQLGVNYADIYANSNLYRNNQELIRQLSVPAPGSKDIYFPTIYAQPFIIQCKACFWKQRLSYWRHPQYNTIRILLTAVISVMCGAVFWDRGDKIVKQQDLSNILGAMYAVAMFLGGANTYAVLPVVDIERTVFYREKQAGMYSALPYAFGQVAIEIIYVAFQTFICSLLLYSMIGFHWEAAKFFWFYYYVFLSFVYFTFYGMMLVALTPSYQIAAVTITFFLSFWNLFSGFVIFRMDIPSWWRWYYWGSPVAWTLYGLVTSQIGDRTDPVQVPGLGDIPLNTYLERFLGFHHDFLGSVAAAHIAWAVLFCFVFAYGIKFLNFQKR